MSQSVLRKLDVLLIQRDGDTRSIFTRILGEMDQCRVHTASNAVEAQEKIAGSYPKLVLFAHGVANGNDLALFSEIHNQYPSARQIVLLPDVEKELASEYQEAGAADCLVIHGKGFSKAIPAIHEELVQLGSNLAPSISSEESLKPGQAILHYRIIERIGSGAMGEVYKAEDLRLGRVVAIKVLQSKMVAETSAKLRLISEARTASALNHPNIVTIYSVEEVAEQSFIVMEYVEGESLRTLLERGPLPVKQVLDIGIQIADALDAAHSVGLIHRDIKPGNLMITPRGQAKLLDFGIAKQIESSSGEQFASLKRLTGPGFTMGTVLYMSPEQVRGRELDGRSDLFSIGTVLHEAATGRPPFDGDNVFTLFDQIENFDPPPASTIRSSVPFRFDVVIGTAMAKEPWRRYARASDFANAMRRLKASLSETLSGAASVRLSTAPYRELSEFARRQGKSIAVLYFENLDGAREDEYLRDGMTEDVITELSKISELRVFPRSAVVAYRDKFATVQQIGSHLNAAFVLSGSMRRAGDRIRITIQLMETQTGQLIWGERYDRRLTDVFDLQEEIARSIAQALRITLTPQEEVAIARKPTENPEVYDYYLRGRNYTRRATRADLEFAIQMFERAIKLEPEFPLAPAGLANVCGLYYDWYEQNERWIQRGLDAAKRALLLDPELPEGVAARARIFWGERRYERAIEFARKALELKYDCEGAYWVLGLALFALERCDEGADLIDQAIQASGDDYNVYVPFINILGQLGRTEEISKLRRHQMHILKQQLEWVPEDARARMLLSTNHAYFGDRTSAVHELQKAVALRPQDANLLYNAACTYGVLHMKEEALEHVKMALLAGFHNRDWVGRDPDLTCLHDVPEFNELIKP